MSNTALLIIDMHVGNFSEPNPVYNANELLGKVKSLIRRARSAQTPIIYVQNNGSTGDPDEYSTPGWEIHPTIQPAEEDVVTQKQTPDAFHETNLHHELKSREIKRLIIVGLQTEYCIDTTCRRAFTLGYEVTLVKDAHSTWDSSTFTAQQIIEHHNNVLGGWFATLKDKREIKF
ncbi:MAG: cysteine hydrolase [Candidatus Bathyarchaeota archaeon]|nr:MAG: cysteine hydrolase [Candidatus Bathyarchaeota archaeon]